MKMRIELLLVVIVVFYCHFFLITNYKVNIDEKWTFDDLHALAKSSVQKPFHSFKYVNNKSTPCEVPNRILASGFFNSSAQQIINCQDDNITYSIVFSTTVESANNTVAQEVYNTLYMLSMYAREFNCITVVFTSTPAIIECASSLGHTVVTSTRLNRFGLPFIQDILEVSKLLYSASYYGYINSDILFSSNLFTLLTKVPQAVPRMYPVHELALTVKEIGITSLDMIKDSHDLDMFLQYRTDSKPFRHQDSADLFIFSKHVNYTFVRNIVVGRVLLDNCLMRIMHFQRGELINMNNVVIGVHQGFAGFKTHLKEQKATWSDISWNQNVTRFKYIIHQGTLRLANRVAVVGGGGSYHFILKKPRVYS